MSYKIIDLKDKNIYSTAAAIKEAGLDWEVDEGKLQLETYLPQENRHEWKPLTNHKGIYRTDTSEPLGQCVVGKGFSLVQNTQAFHCFDRILSSHQAQFISGGHFHNGASVFLQCKLPSGTQMRNGDTTERYLLIAQGHTGQQSLTARFTHIRPVCWNTLMAALRDSYHSYSLKHTKNWEVKMASAISYMKRGLMHLDKVEQMFDKMSAFRLTEEQQISFLKLAYERKQDETLREWKKWAKLEPIFLEAKGKEYSEGSLWHPLMVLSEFEDHVAPVNNMRGESGKVRTPEVIQQARQVRAMFHNPVVNRKADAFKLAVDVVEGRTELPGKRGFLGNLKSAVGVA